MRQKHTKSGAISDDFKIYWRISPECIKIFKVGQVLLACYVPNVAKRSI